MIHLINNYWAVEVPEYGHSFEIIKDECNDYIIAYKGKEWLKEDEYHILNLPPGTWEIVCTSKEATEEQAAEVVEYIVSDMLSGYRFYGVTDKSVIEAIAYTPVSSLHSLLTSKGCDLNKT